MPTLVIGISTASEPGQKAKMVVAAHAALCSNSIIMAEEARICDKGPLIATEAIVEIVAVRSVLNHHRHS